MKLIETVNIGRQTSNDDPNTTVYDAVFEDESGASRVELELFHVSADLTDRITNAELAIKLTLNGWSRSALDEVFFNTENVDDDSKVITARVREFDPNAASVILAELRDFNRDLETVVFVRNVRFPGDSDIKSDTFRQALDGVMYDYLGDSVAVTVIIEVDPDDSGLVHVIEHFWEHEVGFTQFSTPGLYRSTPKDS